MSLHTKRDHGGGLDAAAAQYGGRRQDWMDLSTGINPAPYPVADLPQDIWTALPDAAAMAALTSAARRFWNIPDAAAVLATPGASAPIAQIPFLSRPAPTSDVQADTNQVGTGQVSTGQNVSDHRTPGTVAIPGPTYNEHAAAFQNAGWQIIDQPDNASMPRPDAQVIVHPNNPTGHLHDPARLTAPLCVIDESFADVTPGHSLIALTEKPGRLVLKSFGKFWGLAGLRLGFVMGAPDLVDQIAQRLGPWPVSGPALAIGARALADTEWARTTRAQLAHDADRLDTLMLRTGATLTGGTSLFRLYDHPDAAQLHSHLARHHIWTRRFPWSDTAIRLGLPAPADWDRLRLALTDAPTRTGPVSAPKFQDPL